MANLFLGFPVSRAKIAELIEGSAPPLAHAAWHKPDGSDPLVLPADISAGQNVQWSGTKYIGASGGGLSSLYDAAELFYGTLFESLDGWETFISGTGAVTLDTNKVTAAAGGGAGDIAGILQRFLYPHITLTWAKRRRFKLHARVDVYSDASSQIFICTGNEGTNQRGFGFRFTNDKVRGFSQNGGAAAYADLVTGLTPPYTRDELYEAVFTPGVKVEYFIDGVSKGTVTTSLPTGTTGADRFFRIMIYASATVAHTISTSTVIVSQDS